MIFTLVYIHVIAHGIIEIPLFWPIVSLEKADVFLLQHLPSINRIKTAPVETDNERKPKNKVMRK